MSRAMSTYLLTIWLLTAATGVHAADCIEVSDSRTRVDYDAHARWLEAFDYMLEIHGFEVVNDHVIVHAPFDRIRILSLVDGRPGDEVAEIPIWGSMYGCEVEGDLLYLSHATDGLFIYDVSNPAQPSWVATLYLEHARELRVENGIVYVCSLANGLYVVDATEPASPVLRSTVPIGTTSFPAVRDSIAYVYIGGNEVQIVDCTDLDSPAVVGSLEVPGFVADQEIDGSLLYTLVRFNGPDVFDISDPLAPVLLTHVSLPPTSSSVDLCASRGRVCVAIRTVGVALIDARDPHAITLQGIVDTRSWAYAVEFVGDNVFVGLEHFGIDVVDVTPLRLPAERGAAEIPEITRDLRVRDGLAYVVADDVSLTVIDVSTPERLSVVGQADTPGNATSVALAGDVAWIGCTDGIDAVNVADPSRPVYLGRTNLPDVVTDMAVMGDLVLLAAGDSGVAIVDGSDPLRPELVVVHDLGDRVLGLHVEGSLAYVGASEAGLVILDLSDPTLPVEVGRLNGDGWYIQNVAVHDGLAVLADFGDHLRVVDVSTPAAPVTMATLRVPANLDRVSILDHLVAASSYSDMHLIDVSNPDAPRLIGGYSDVQASEITPHCVVGLGSDQRRDQIVTVALPCGAGVGVPVGDTNRSVAARESPMLSALAAPYPNPFNPSTTLQFMLATPGRAVLTIHDARGRTVRHLVAADLPAGPHARIWNGRDSRGAVVPSGTYYCRLETVQGVSTTRATLIK